MTVHIVFLCAQQSSRALLAASLLHAQSKAPWEVWCTPPDSDGQRIALVKQVLQEQGIALLPSDHLIVPVFGMHWDEGIILCSGATDT